MHDSFLSYYPTNRCVWEITEQHSPPKDEIFSYSALKYGCLVFLLWASLWLTVVIVCTIIHKNLCIICKCLCKSQALCFWLSTPKSHLWSVKSMKRKGQLLFVQPLLQVLLCSIHTYRKKKEKCIKTWREDRKRTEWGSFRLSPVPAWKAAGTNCITGSSIWMSGSTGLLCRRWSTGRGAHYEVSLEIFRSYLVVGTLLWVSLLEQRLGQMASRAPFQL